MVEEERAARWRRSKDTRPGDLLEAALDCFAERGFAATRLEDVAKRAGVTKGTAYLYFKSKEELFKAVVRGFIVPAIEQFESLAGSEGPVSERLARIAGLFADKVVNSRLSALPKLIVAEAGNFPEIAEFYLDEVLGRGRRLIGSLLRRGVESGEFREVDVEHAAYCLVAPLMFSALWKHSLGPFDAKPLDTKALVTCHLELFLRGLAPDRPSQAAPRATTPGPARGRGGKGTTPARGRAAR